MTMTEMLDLMEANVNGLGASPLVDQHIAVEARATKTVENDIQAIQDTLSCLKGMCSVQWKPAR